VIAVAAGAGLTPISYAMMTRASPEGISRHFLERAYTEGGGTNVVNVILVDFRGFDTLGEIAVLGIVALTVFALLRRFRPAPESVGMPEQQRIRRMAATTGWMADPGRDHAAALSRSSGVVAIYLLLRGHDLPGGGFAAGLTLAIGVLLQYMAGGDALGGGPSHASCRCAGSASACCSPPARGRGPSLFGKPFLTSYFAYADLGILGKLPLASAVLFDLGVFALVFGATVLMLIALAHQSVRSQRAAPPPALPQPGGRLTDGTHPRARIGILAGSGVWLLMRPRTFQVIIGLSLLSYAVNLFIFSMGRFPIGAPPILEPGTSGDPGVYADPCRRRWC
jgi:multicomponent K+:H+ antiporter subunit A